MESTSKALKYIDFLGYKPELNLGETNSFHTIFGGLISLAVIILSVACLVFLGLELILKTNPIVVTSIGTVDNFGPFYITNKGFMVAIGVGLENFTFYVDEGIFTPSGKISVLKTKENTKMGELDQLVEEIDVNLDICTNFYKIEDLKRDFNRSLPYDKFFCIQPNTSMIEGYYGYSIYRGLKINIEKCVNSSLNNFKCKSQEIIEEYLHNGVLDYIVSNSYVDPTNLENPFQKMSVDIFQPIPSEGHFNIYLPIQKSVIKTDTAFVFETYNHQDVFVEVGSGQFYYNPSKSALISTILIEGIPTMKTTLRKYNKVQDILSNLGGLINP